MLRWYPFVASFWCAAAIILAFHVLLAGFGNDSLDGVAIITLNTTSLGLADYYQANSTLHSNVTALVPASVTNPASIAQYLGIKHWYSINYLSTCSGFFSLDPNSNLLTSQWTNVTCTKKNSGYVFTISNILRDELHPSVATIADTVTQASYYTAPWIALWYIGIVFAILEMLIFLPMTWPGTRRLNGYSTLFSFISYITFQVASGLTTSHFLRAYHAQTLPPALHSTEYLAMAWTTMALMFVVLFLVHIEWRFELWTLKGEAIRGYRKPVCKSWNLLEAFWDRNPTGIDGKRRREEYEMH